MKTTFLKRPKSIRYNNNNSINYRYDLKEISHSQLLSEGLENNLNFNTVKWECKEVIVFEPLSSNKIFAAVLQEEYGNGVEEKLINDYNAAILGMLDESIISNKIEAYKNFLKRRESLKSEIEISCIEFGINK